MAKLSEQQHEILTNLRREGLEAEALKLQMLFKQLSTRPEDSQVIELITNMVKQYLGDTKMDAYLETQVPEPPPVQMTVRMAESVDGIGEKGDKVTMDLQPCMKPRLELVLFDFIVEMALWMQGGLLKGNRKPHDWQELGVEGLDEKRGALLRHYGKREWAAVATNAMILWWHDKNRRKK